MSSITCLPAAVNCFVDPDVDQDAVLELMRQRAKAEKLRELKPSEWECSEKVLKRFLVNNVFHLENTAAAWTDWVKWRHCKFYLRVTMYYSAVM
jgi:hypothetical protein